MEYSVKNAILKAAEPYLKGKTVEDVVVGVSLIACRLSDGGIGVAYLLRENLPAGCGFGYAGELVGAPAEAVAKLLVEGKDDLRRGIGNAVLTAAICDAPGICDDDSGDTFGLEPQSRDTVGMVGLIRPVAKKLTGKAGRLIVFDEGAYRSGESGVLATELESELLPKCGKVVLTGSSTINGSIDGLLSLCENAEKLVIAGSSTPMLADGWRDSPVTELAGTYWKKECWDDIFRTVALGGGIKHLKGCSEKKIVHLK